MPTDTQANCLRCNGSGEWVNPRNDMDRRPCFGCQGNSGARFAGRRYYRRPTRWTPDSVTVGTGVHAVSVPAIPEAAAIAPRVTANASVARFESAYPAEYRWLVSGSGGTFAESLLRGIARYGNLTPRQLAAVQRNLPTGDHAPIAPTPGRTIAQYIAESDAARVRNADRPTLPGIPTAPFPAPPVAGALDIRNPPPAPVVVNLDLVRTAMESARASGLRKVKLAFGDVTLKLSGNTFRGGNGMILCYHRGIYAGYVNPANAFIRAYGRTVTDEMLDAFRAVGVDPRAAAATHGHDTGNCACCGRLLSDPPSVMAGIGPVCIRRFGWGF